MDKTKLLADLATAPQAEFDEFIGGLSAELRQEAVEMRTQVLIALDAQDARGPVSVAGFRAHFKVIFGMELPNHQKEPIERTFEAHESDEFIGVVIEEFRGAAKTTIFTLGLASYLIAKYPTRSGILVQVGDDSAADNSGQIADIIANNPGWKLLYPHIVPDEQLGWGAKGYEVKLTREYPGGPELPYDAWRQMNAGRKDSTLLGVGYKSRALIGRRPFWLIVDDMNDENNTSSERELRKARTILTGTIFPAANHAEWFVIIGTPWTENDIIHYCLQTGLFTHVKVPVYAHDGAPAWPERFPEAEIAKQRKLAGEIEFARMFLLDLSKTKGLILKKEWLKYWPHQEVRDEWPVLIGIDYTSTSDPLRLAGDYFALAVGRVIPGGRGVVITEGVRAKVSQAEAEDFVIAWSARYPRLLVVGVEAIITGNEFYNNLLNNAGMRSAGIAPLPVRFRKDKAYRFEKQMAPLFQRGRVYLSDAEDHFLTAFKDEWMHWQGNQLEDQYHNDTLDAVYAMLFNDVGKGYATPIGRVPDDDSVFNPMWAQPKQPNPFANLRRGR